MKSKKLLILIILFLCIIIFITSFIYLKNKNKFNEGPQNSNQVILNINIIDNKTTKPLNEVIIYVGATYEGYKCYTRDNGQCSIKTIPIAGDYGLRVFKKGYKLYSEMITIKNETKSIYIELEKREVAPKEITLKGTLIKTMTNAGTRNENVYLKIQDENNNENYVFNEIGENYGFEEFINKKVEIKGFLENGFIGWEGEEVEGIYIEEITLN